MSLRQGGNTIAGAVGKYPLNERNISNCITEIPQDIKLELNNGTLTLKAGSKVYVPNGAGVFDTVTIASDINIGLGTGSYTKMIFVKSDGTTSTRTTPTTCYSGSSAPTGTGQGNMAWYDTTNNLVKLTSDSGSTWTSGYSLPIATATITSGVITSIDQVFNGFGYIGSTVFALPGVKMLMPYYRNADGSLKNYEKTLVSVLTSTNQPSDGEWYFNILWSDYLVVHRIDGESYDEAKNILIWGGGENVACICGCLTYTSSKITSMTPKTVFHALDYNDTEYMAHQAMPSGRYINLTLGSSGASYTAPADGYVVFDKASSGANQYIRMTTSDGLRVLNNSTGSGQYLAVFLPVKKNQQFYVSYSAGGATNSFRFIYANGAQ